MTSRAERVAALIRAGSSRQQIADDLGIRVSALNVWASRHNVLLPLSASTPGRPVCRECRRRHVARSRFGDGTTRPAKHGLCMPCRKARRTTQTAFAFNRWTSYSTFGPGPNAELEHFAWCVECNTGGQADDEPHAQRWATRHNERNHT